MNKATTLKSQVKSKRGYVMTRVLFKPKEKPHMCSPLFFSSSSSFLPFKLLGST